MAAPQQVRLHSCVPSAVHNHRSPHCSNSNFYSSSHQSSIQWKSAFVLTPTVTQLFPPPS
jgi:hypothetical protein